MTTSTGMEASRIGTSLQEGSKQLLPGIPDEITLGHIVPKLPWEIFYSLSCVSRAWLHGIRTREVYDARVLSRSTETLGFVSFFRSRAELRPTVGFCSMREDRRGSKPKYVDIQAPCTGSSQIPYRGGRWVCVDGYIYLLAAQKEHNANVCSSEVFVFDVAGQGQWKQCASMTEPRRRFGCGVMHGKLYVFGGLSTDASLHDPNPPAYCGSEVYDPKEDSWSPIRPTTTFRWDVEVETVGHELFLYSGEFLDRDRFNSRNDADTRDVEVYLRAIKPRCAKFLEIYHPVKDEWRVASPFRRDRGGRGRLGDQFQECLFAAGGKLYSIDWKSIHVYAGENSWTHLHSCSFPLTEPDDSFVVQVSAAIVVDGELVVEAWLGSNDGGIGGISQFQSKGFGGESEEILWQEAPTFQMFYSTIPHSSKELIQL